MKENLFEKIKIVDGNTIQLDDLEAGLYRFTYFLELGNKEINIEVIKG